jgi:hypothetical protein
LEFALALKKALTAHGVGPGPGVPEWNSLWRSRRRSRLTGWSLGQVCQNSVAQTASVTQGRDGSQTWRRPKQMPVDEKSLPGVRLQPGEVGLSEQRVCFGWRPGAPGTRIQLLLGWRVVHSENCASLERNTFDEAAQRAARQNTNCTSLPKPTCIPGPSRRHARWVSNGLKEFCPMDFGISGELLIFCSVEGGIENLKNSSSLDSLENLGH